jgi:hypothetical protein
VVARVTASGGGGVEQTYEAARCWCVSVLRDPAPLGAVGPGSDAHYVEGGRRFVPSERSSHELPTQRCSA